MPKHRQSDSQYDVIIAGGAIIGSSCAWFLSRHPQFSGRILVVEKDPSYQQCSTTLSAASIRQQFSSAVNVSMSRYGFNFFKSIQTERKDEGGIGLVEGGYLLLAGDQGAAHLRHNFELQKKEGADIGLFEPSELAQRFPWMSVEGVALGSLGLSGEGWFDAYSVLRYFKQGAQANGVTFLKGEVAGLDVKGGLLRSVRLSDGSRYSCGNFVNACGTAAAAIAAMADIEVKIEPRKRCVFVIDCREAASLVDCPMVIDSSGVYFRPEGKCFISGVSPPKDQDPVCDDFNVDYALFDDIIWPALAERVPVFEAIKVVNAWAGHYAYNVFDQNMILGPHPSVGNFFFANGFSGRGVQQSPAVGRAISEYIICGSSRSLDLSELGFERIANNRPVIEESVY